jgi:putative phage-type endonuclease
MATAILDTMTGRQLSESDWLEIRRCSLGASECAAALGVSPFDTPIDIWQRKIGKAPPVAETDAMRWGKKLERVIQEEYEERTGETLATQVFARHPERPWMTATLDGLTPAGKVVEFKTASAFAREWGDEADEVPMQYLVQLHHQMVVVGATEADLAVLIGGQDFRVYSVRQDADLARHVRTGAERFWRCVETRTPPDWGRLDAKALAVLHPRCEGSIDLDADTVAAVALYEQYGLNIEFAEKQREACKLQILTAMGDAQFGALPDGRRVKRFREECPERQVPYVTKATVKNYFKVVKGAR